MLYESAYIKVKTSTVNKWQRKLGQWSDQSRWVGSEGEDGAPGRLPLGVGRCVLFTLHIQ